MSIEIEKKIIVWAKEKGILEKATPTTQMDKTVEEVRETNEALICQANNLKTYINSKGRKCITKEEIIDGFGDILVTVVIGLEMQGLTVDKAMEHAYDVIKNRKGKMINGTFVKDN